MDWFLYSGLAVSAGVVVLSGALVGGNSEVVRWLCIAGLSVGTVASICLTGWANYRSRRREVDAINAAIEREKTALQIQVAARTEAQIEIGSAINRMIISILKGIADLRDSSPEDVPAVRRSLRETIQELAVNIAPQIIGPKDKTRSCYFDFQPGPPKRLVPTHVSGCVRELAPRIESFVYGTKHGDYVIGKVEANQADFYPDLDEKKPDDFDISKLGYRTFISVPVASALGDSSTAYGLLSVDAPEAGQLGTSEVANRDFALMRVMAGLVTIAMAIAEASDTTSAGMPWWTPTVKPSISGRGRHRVDALKRRMSRRRGSV